MTATVRAVPFMIPCRSGRLAEPSYNMTSTWTPCHHHASSISHPFCIALSLPHCTLSPTAPIRLSLPVLATTARLHCVYPCNIIIALPRCSAVAVRHRLYRAICSLLHSLIVSSPSSAIVWMSLSASCAIPPQLSTANGNNSAPIFAATLPYLFLFSCCFTPAA